MSTVLFIVAGILGAAGFFMLFFRAPHDRAEGSPSNMKFGDMSISSAKPSLFLIGIAVIVVLIAAKIREDEKNREMINNIVGPNGFGGGY